MICLRSGLRSKFLYSFTVCGFYVVRDLQEPHPPNSLSYNPFDRIIYCFIAIHQRTVRAEKRIVIFGPIFNSGHTQTLSAGFEPVTGA